VSINVLGEDRSRYPIWTISREQLQPPSFLLSIKEFTDNHFGAVCYGSIGNEYFRNDLLVFDARHNRFGRVRGEVR
jgi:hypothetical protein